MSSFTVSGSVSPTTTAGSSTPAPTRNGSMTQKRVKSRKPANLDQPENVISTVHGRCISLPVETKSTSPTGADFNYGLPSHEFETRRQSPTVPTTGGDAPSPLLTSPSSMALGTPTTPSSIQPLLPPFRKHPDEISAFDSDTDDEGPSQSVKVLKKKFSVPILRRPRAETVPVASRRNVSKDASLTSRISKQDIKTPGVRFSNGSDNAAATTGSGINTARTSNFTAGPTLAAKPSVAASPSTTLWKKTTNRESPSRRTSSASKASKRSGAPSAVVATPLTTDSMSGTGNRRKDSSSSGRRLCTWIARVLGRRNTQ